MLQLSPCLVVVILYMSLQSILVETKWWSCCRGEEPIDCRGWACIGVTMQSIYLNFKQKRRSKNSLSVTIWAPLHLWGYCVTCVHVIGLYEFLSYITTQYFRQGTKICLFKYHALNRYEGGGITPRSLTSELAMISFKPRPLYHWEIANRYHLNIVCGIRKYISTNITMHQRYTKCMPT